MKKIELDKRKAIAFIGTMNAMPMMYALELRRLGYDVIYFVEVPRANKLSRPENHFAEITYPYPNWIIEYVVPSQALIPFFPRLISAVFRRLCRRATSRSVGCFFLNGHFISIAPFLRGKGTIIALCHGSDLDVWADVDSAERLATSFRRRSVFSWMPEFLSRSVIVSLVHRQFLALKGVDAVIYFPRGFNAEGDRVLKKLETAGVRYVPRYDISFSPLLGESRDPKSASDSLNLFSGVRFLFESFPDGNRGYCKGNDRIIEGIAKFYAVDKRITVHFVEKGEDVARAKELCAELGIDKVVVWHKEMPFRDLLQLYRLSDICFDQVGEHWIGAIGGYAMYLGRPLIANANTAVRAGIWPADNPVCSAETSDEIFEWLIKLRDPALRTEVSKRSQKFVEEYMNPQRSLNQLFELSQATKG